MRKIRSTKEFRNGYMKLSRSGRRNMEKLNVVMRILASGSALPIQYRDHRLNGHFQEFRECHVEGDWLLIYSIVNDESGSEVLTFCASGNHSNLFQ